MPTGWAWGGPAAAAGGEQRGPPGVLKPRSRSAIPLRSPRPSPSLPRARADAPAPADAVIERLPGEGSRTAT